MEGPSLIIDGAEDSLARAVKECAILPLDDSGDGSNRLGLLSPPSALGTGSGEESSLPQKTSPSEEPLYTETIVEVCVKMVVCRKYITNTIHSETGKVLSSSVRTEEDPSTVLNVHTYKIPTDPTQSSSHTSADRIQPSSTTSIPIPTPPVKRKPGRPRKNPIPLVSSSPVKASSSEKQSDLADKSAAVEMVKAGEASTEIDSSPEREEDPSDSAAETITKTERKSIISTRRQASAAVPPSKERLKKPVTSVAVRRRMGRPARVIKKPRKYLDGFDEEFFKSQSAGAPEDSNNEEDSQEEEESVEEDKDQKEGREASPEEELDSEKNGQAMDGVEEGGEQRTECPKCGKRFSNPSNCQRHINKEQCNDQRQCRFCDKVFETRTLLKAHMESHRDHDNENNYRCNDCNRTYATRNGYLKHKRQGTCYKRDVFHEDGTQGEFECSLCRVRFTTEKLLELHKEKVHENPNNEYKCPDCSRVFYSKLGFNKHVAKKSCTQPHECKVCGKKYSNKAKESFKSHMRYHLAETSGVQFQCEDCGRVYMTDMALKKHRLTSHSGLRPYKCSTCSKTFPMRYMVRDHERSHTGEKPFLCSLCGTSFSNRGHLYRHMRSHALGTLHKCGRPRKYPAVSRPVYVKLKDGGEERQETFQNLGEREEPAAELGEVEIKTDPTQQDDAQEDMGSLGAGPTYITVHTIDGQLGDPATTQSIIREGQLQHVVMETPDGMSDNMVLQVIQNLTGATTVYQQITEQPAVSLSDGGQGQPSQIIMSTGPQQGMSHRTLVVEPGPTEGVGQSMVTGRQVVVPGEGQQQQFVVNHTHTPVTQT